MQTYKGSDTSAIKWAEMMVAHHKRQSKKNNNVNARKRHKRKMRIWEQKALELRTLGLITNE